MITIAELKQVFNFHFNNLKFERIKEKMDDRPRLNSLDLARTYDVIFVGQLGAVVASLIVKQINFSFKFLVINNTKVIVEPSLSSVNNEKISIRKHCPKNCDLETKSISKINPIIRQI